MIPPSLGGVLTKLEEAELPGVTTCCQALLSVAHQSNKLK